MGKSTIPLSKGYNATKIKFPCSVSIKYDGVPIAVEATKLRGEIYIRAYTRQDTTNTSMSELRDEIAEFLDMSLFIEEKESVIILGEVTHPEYPAFKDLSGKVRKQQKISGFVWNLFDLHLSAAPEDIWSTRNRILKNLVARIGHERIVHVQQIHCETRADVEHCLSRIDPEEEGGVIRWHGDLWEPNSRRWGYMKHVVAPTVDLRVVGFSEAVSKDGKPLGRVGRVKCMYKGGVIGVGAGKMTHAEATKLWARWVEHCLVLGWSVHAEEQYFLFDGKPSICEVRYKRDPSYTALREPTFQHWRPEKTEESYE